MLAEEINKEVWRVDLFFLSWFTSDPLQSHSLISTKFNSTQLGSSDSIGILGIELASGFVFSPGLGLLLWD
jgi:hypothetical protein